MTEQNAVVMRNMEQSLSYKDLVIATSQQQIEQLKREKRQQLEDSEQVIAQLQRRINELELRTGTPQQSESGSKERERSFLDAVKTGQLDKVRMFHQQGAILTAPDSNTWTPLHHAATLGRTEIVRYLADNSEWYN